MSKGKAQQTGSVVGLPHHRRPLRQSRRLLKWSVLLGALSAAIVLLVLWQLISR